MDRHRHRAADSRARPERDVHRAEDLLVLQHVAGQLCAIVGAHAKLGEVGALLAVGLQALQVQRAQTAVRRHQASALHSQGCRLIADPERPEAHGDDPPFPCKRSDETLAAGQVAEGAA